MNSLAHTLLTKVRGSHRDEQGFTLIELLVVILIIGILAAIAIPMFLNQRASAAEASLKSDLRSAADEVETVSIKSVAQSKDIVDGGAAASEKDSFVVDGKSYEVQTSDGTELTFSGKTGSDATGGGFIINGTNGGTDAVWTYDSMNGGLVSQGSGSEGGAESPADNYVRLMNMDGGGDYVDMGWSATEFSDEWEIIVTDSSGNRLTGDIISSTNGITLPVQSGEYSYYPIDFWDPGTDSSIGFRNTSTGAVFN